MYLGYFRGIIKLSYNSYHNKNFLMSLFDDQFADFRVPWPHCPFNGRNSLTDHKKASDVPLQSIIVLIKGFSCHLMSNKILLQVFPWMLMSLMQFAY